ncbi:hypothetical protein [Streptomyces sp. Root1310]|uniref:hypothetical protein n=1 Tax=Streptomyces sp. Root1310 TaxID=1736452 RepID=UPI0018FED047|nr:hypothetical protein [Streptomyces sp. Root1310]
MRTNANGLQRLSAAMEGHRLIRDERDPAQHRRALLALADQLGAACATPARSPPG